MPSRLSSAKLNLRQNPQLPHREPHQQRAEDPRRGDRIAEVQVEDALYQISARRRAWRTATPPVIAKIASNDRSAPRRADEVDDDQRLNREGDEADLVPDPGSVQVDAS
jgi:hypothetical protein